MIESIHFINKSCVNDTIRRQVCDLTYDYKVAQLFVEV